MSNLGNGLSSDKTALNVALSRIQVLKVLYQKEVITEEDFQTRREQIINELTGTTSQSTRSRKGSFMTSSTTMCRFTKSLTNSVIGSPLDSQLWWSRSRRLPGSITQIKKHPPPDWKDSAYPVESACKVTYNFLSKGWERKDVRVQIDTTPFDKGGLRLVFHLRDTSEPSTAFVAKISRDPRDSKIRSLYFADVRMQAVAAYFATKYNSYNPPKKVKFLKACVLELNQREGSPVCGVERFISGHYKKYNNNTGWVSEDDRNTPGTFSHFSYVASDGELLICDIQGVGDIYTDPQIHSRNGQGFGQGNLGQEGIQHFLCRHRCNRICKFLRLPNLTGLPYREEGTRPLKTLMNKMQVTQLTEYENMRTPLLSKSRRHFPALRKEKRGGCPCFCGILCRRENTL